MSARDVTAELAEALRLVEEACRGHIPKTNAWARALLAVTAARKRYDAERAPVEPRPASPARLDAERAAEKARDADTTDRGPTHVIRSRGSVFHAYGETDAHYVRDTVGGEIERIRDEPVAFPARLCAICGETEACDGCAGRCVRCARLSRECC